MRRFIFITFLIAFAGHIIANDFDFTKQIQQYGDEGDFSEWIPYILLHAGK